MKGKHIFDIHPYSVTFAGHIRQDARHGGFSEQTVVAGKQRETHPMKKVLVVDDSLSVARQLEKIIADSAILPLSGMPEWRRGHQDEPDRGP